VFVFPFMAIVLFGLVTWAQAGMMKLETTEPAVHATATQVSGPAD
jgi:hypothetical protein